jgi:hypothetical protein
MASLKNRCKWPWILKVFFLLARRKP